MGLSWEQRREIAEVRAWQEFGERHGGMIRGAAFAKAAAPALGVAVILGSVGWGGWWAWQHIGSAATTAVASAPAAAQSGTSGSVPDWVWWAIIMTLGVAGFLFRPGRIPSAPGFGALKLIAVLVALGGLVAYAFGSMNA